LLLCLIRKVYNSYHRIRETGSFSLEGLRGEELFGKTIGMIGTGRIGTEVIKIAKGFSMNVIAYDKYPKEELAQELDFKYVSLEELLSQSDIITLHVPHNKETHHLLNKDNLSKTKKGVYIINTARGGIIETQALYRALKDGQVGGAALDVLEEELKEVKNEYKDYVNEIEKYVNVTEGVTVSIDVDGQKYTVPIPEPTSTAKGEVADNTAGITVGAEHIGRFTSIRNYF